ncbi:hypothetical protein PV327_010458 [Microctonus hyperodae]|uniref:Uncharacterized protein n=1 Tax=Microctonus hyperodae TaxID=165561 RepID=A0AA39FSI1_MICHY|nr:hypothetical protein PV327_010458 [Microctonus hyperodae]
MNRTNAERSLSASGSKAGTSSSSSSTIALGDSTFNSLALDVSLAGLSINNNGTTATPSPGQRSNRNKNIWEMPDDEETRCDDDDDELWEDIGVIEYLDKKLGTPDESTEEERVEALKEVLQDTDIHEGDGDLSDFLFHVARTKHGKIYIRVIRTWLLNRGI